MSTFETILSIVVGMLSVLSAVSPFIYKVIRGNIMEETSKMINRKIETFDKKNEDIREERQIRYVENLDGIRKHLDKVSITLNKIELDILNYGKDTLEHSFRIRALEETMNKMQGKQ